MLDILLFVLFLGLKLTNQIDWSWWFVFMPLIIGWLIYFIKNYKYL